MTTPSAQLAPANAADWPWLQSAIEMASLASETCAGQRPANPDPAACAAESGNSHPGTDAAVRHGGAGIHAQDDAALGCGRSQP